MLCLFSWVADDADHSDDDDHDDDDLTSISNTTQYISTHLYIDDPHSCSMISLRC
jgi:hypothetical protein